MFWHFSLELEVCSDFSWFCFLENSITSIKSNWSNHKVQENLSFSYYVGLDLVASMENYRLNSILLFFLRLLLFFNHIYFIEESRIILISYLILLMEQNCDKIVLLHFEIVCCIQIQTLLLLRKIRV